MEEETNRVTGNVEYPLFFRRGESFLYASRLVKPLRRQAIEAAAHAYAANAAFATEVYLKVLRNIECGDKHLNEHHLRKLFEDLPTYLQAKIEEVWTKEEAKLKWSGNTTRAPKKFRDVLNQSAQAFYKFRYVTDKELHFYIDQLPYVLRWAILAKRPDWKPVFGTPYSSIDPHPTLVKCEFHVTARLGWPLVFNDEAAALKL